MKISFIIKFKNEGTHIEDCVASIFKQKGEFNKEFVFVNDSSTDYSIEFVKKFAQNPPKNCEVKVINLIKGGFTYASSFNKGAEVATGEIIANVTAHSTLLTENSLSNMLENFEDEKVAGVYPKIYCNPSSNTFGVLAKARANSDEKIIRSEATLTEVEKKKILNYQFIGTFCLIRADFFKQDKFRELPRCEDLEWGYRMIKKGYRIVYDPSAAIEHFDGDGIKKIANRWITATLAINLILTLKAPPRVTILRSCIISLTTFTLRVILKEPKILKKVYYVWLILWGSVLIKKEILLNYKKYSNWQEKYLVSLT